MVFFRTARSAAPRMRATRSRAAEQGPPRARASSGQAAQGRRGPEERVPSRAVDERPGRRRGCTPRRQGPRWPQQGPHEQRGPPGPRPSHPPASKGRHRKSARAIRPAPWRLPLSTEMRSARGPDASVRSAVVCGAACRIPRRQDAPHRHAGLRRQRLWCFRIRARHSSGERRSRLRCPASFVAERIREDTGERCRYSALPGACCLITGRNKSAQYIAHMSCQRTLYVENLHYGP